MAAHPGEQSGRWIMPLVIPPPMLAKPVPALPEKAYFEVKWDGYRARLAVPDDGPVQLVSRRGAPLDRAFPELAAAAARDLPPPLLLDGEIVVWAEGRLAFDRLQQRARHTGATAARMAVETPAHFVAFDLLHEAGEQLLSLPYTERRHRLEQLFERAQLGPPWTLCPMTTSRDEAQQWMTQWAPVGVEGILVKDGSSAYRPNVRGWKKYKPHTSHDVLVGGVTGTLRQPTTVLVGRRDTSGHLHYLGRSTPITGPLRRELAAHLSPASPEHPWQDRTFSSGVWGAEREPLEVTLTAPDLVVEVAGDVARNAAGRWRHPVRLLRVRPDLAPEETPPPRE
ncbi:ATP-dependent DNA ligase [Streptomyces abikoensis]|uniref:ATP-dependent DNA ligase n=1 Tax=Streptomyces abikoensis TaxID=97398 RepID=UPI00340364C8